MKNKVIIAFIVIICIIAIGCFCLIFNGIKKDNQPINDVATNVEKKTTEEETTKDNSKVKDEATIEKSENVSLNSKVGVNVLKNFNFSEVNFFSDSLYDEIDANGLSDKAKLMYSYLYATSSEKYLDKLEYNEKYQTDCISSSSLEEVAKSIFGNSTNLKNQDILTGNVYKSEDNVYQNIPIRFGGVNAEYSFDIPYQIKEYSDRVEVSCARVYLTAVFNSVSDEISEKNEDTEDVSQSSVEPVGKSSISVYSNRNRSNLVLEIEDEDFIASSNQGEILQEYLTSNKIDVSKLKIDTYVLEKEGENYVIKSIEK